MTKMLLTATLLSSALLAPAFAKAEQVCSKSVRGQAGASVCFSNLDDLSESMTVKTRMLSQTLTVESTQVIAIDEKNNLITKESYFTPTPPLAKTDIVKVIKSVRDGRLESADIQIQMQNDGVVSLYEVVADHFTK